MMLNQILYTEACHSFEKIYTETVLTRKPIEIVREGFESVAIIPIAELESLIETVYLFQSHENATRLLDSLERAKAGTNLPRTVESLRQEWDLGEEEKASA